MTEEKKSDTISRMLINTSKFWQPFVNENLSKVAVSQEEDFLGRAAVAYLIAVVTENDLKELIELDHYFSDKAEARIRARGEWENHDQILKETIEKIQKRKDAYKGNM